MPKPRKRKQANSLEQSLGVRGLTAGSSIANDMFSNFAARTGYGTPSLSQGSSYELIRLSYDYWTLVTLYRNHWLSRRIVDAPAADMVKAWPKITSDIEPKDLTKLDRALRKTNTKNNVLTGMIWARLFGGAGGLIAIDGQENQLDEPLDLESIGIGSYKGIIPFDRWSGISPLGDVCTDINRPLDFGAPEMYECRVTGGDSFKVHSSRLLRFLGPVVPAPENAAQSYWGISVIEPIYESITRLDNMYANLINLSFRANLIGMKFPELAQLLSGLGSSQMASQKFEQRMSSLNHLMSNQSLIPLPADGSIEQTQYSFGGMSDVLQLFQLDLSGAAQIPITRLFGRTYSGLGAAGDGDELIYAERISTDQTTYMLPQMEKLYPVLCMSELGEVPDDLDLVCPSIRVLNEQEKAELAKSTADTVVVYLNSGILSPRRAAMEVKQSSDITGVGTNLDDEFIQKLSDDVTSEGELGEGLFGESGAGLGEADSPAKAIKSENKTGEGEDPEEPGGKDAKKPGAGAKVVKEKAGKASDFAPAMDALPPGLSVGERLLVGSQMLTVAAVGDAVEDLDGAMAVPVQFTNGSVVAYAKDDTEECPNCEGVGKFGTQQCGWCKGTGKTSASVREAVEKVLGKPRKTWDARHGTRKLRRASDEDGPSSVTRLSQAMMDYHALPVRIETLQGQVRAGTTKDGKSWRTTMPADYGFIEGVDGADGDSVDAYVGLSPESNNVFVVDQYDLAGKVFDEHKVMLGYHTEESAKEDYMLGHHLSKKTFAAITGFTMPMFRKWLCTHDHTLPCSSHVTAKR